MAKRNNIWIILALAALWLGPDEARAQTEVRRTIDARPDGLVTISNISGSIEVSGWAQNRVEISGSIGRGIKEVEVSERGGEVEIDVEVGRRGRGWSSEAHLEIRVPQGSSLDIEAVSASVTVEGVSGEVRVEAVSGSIDVEGSSKELDLESVSGRIEVEGDAPLLAVETVSGRIRVKGAIKEAEISTVSGELELHTLELKLAELSSTSGGIEVVAKALASRAQIDIESHSGSVELELPSTSSARFHATTYSGRIDNELGPPAKRTSRYTPGKELEFSLGRGDARVRIETFSGSVYLLRR